ALAGDKLSQAQCADRTRATALLRAREEFSRSERGPLLALEERRAECGGWPAAEARDSVDRDVRGAALDSRRHPERDQAERPAERTRSRAALKRAPSTLRGSGNRDTVASARHFRVAGILDVVGRTGEIHRGVV